MAERPPAGLIVNADDMGIHPATSAGILSAYRNGIVSSISVIVTMPDRDRAITEIVKPNDIPAGLHISLTEGLAVADARLVSDLVDEAGRFRLPAAKLVASTGARDSVLAGQIRKEIEAQFAVARDFGLTLTHVDSHQHVHMNPALFRMIEEIAPRFGVHRIRLTREPVSSLWLTGELSQAAKSLNHVKWLLTRRLASRIKPQLQTTDQFFGLLHSGAITKKVLLPFLRRAPATASIELCVHPGAAVAPDDKTAAPFQRSHYRQREHDALIDTDVKDVIHRRGLRLLSHAGVVKH